MHVYKYKEIDRQMNGKLWIQIHKLIDKINLCLSIDFRTRSFTLSATVMQGLKP